VSGRERVPLNMFQLEHAIGSMVGKVDAIVVSSIFSVHNPAHEEMARQKILERTKKLVVAGHDLTTELGIKERTVTAVLNAKLIPIIGEFLTGVEDSLRKRNIAGQIMVFKGDGSMMSIAGARERPVETILSGPAASLMGGRLLSKLDNCIVLDIGGTSTDIAYLDKGFPRITKEGRRWATGGPGSGPSTSGPVALEATRTSRWTAMDAWRSARTGSRHWPLLRSATLMFWRRSRRPG